MWVKRLQVVKTEWKWSQILILVKGMNMGKSLENFAEEILKVDNNGWQLVKMVNWLKW